MGGRSGMDEEPECIVCKYCEVWDSYRAQLDGFALPYTCINRPRLDVYCCNFKRNKSRKRSEQAIVKLITPLYIAWCMVCRFGKYTVRVT